MVIVGNPMQKSPVALDFQITGPGVAVPGLTHRTIVDQIVMSIFKMPFILCTHKERTKKTFTRQFLWRAPPEHNCTLCFLRAENLGG